MKILVAPIDPYLFYCGNTLVEDFVLTYCNIIKGIHCIIGFIKMVFKCIHVEYILPWYATA